MTKKPTTPPAGTARPDPAGAAPRSSDGLVSPGLRSALEAALKERDSSRAPLVAHTFLEQLRAAGVRVPASVTTPYLNTVPPDRQPPYPGDQQIERKIKSLVRWNAMAMVVKANHIHSGLGGSEEHTSELQSQSNLGCRL